VPLSRRQLLVLASAPPLLAAAGAAGVAGSWFLQRPAPPLRFLSTAEAATVRALCGAAWPATTACPLDGADADLDAYLDELMASLGGLQRDGIRMLLHVIEELPLATDGDRFGALPRDRQAALLQSWLDSDQATVRSALVSVVILTGMGYTTHPDAAATFGSLYRCRYGR